MEKFKYDPEDIFENSESFPSTKTESENREQLSRPHKQTREFINKWLEKDLENGADRIGNSEIIGNETIVSKQLSYFDKNKVGSETVKKIRLAADDAIELTLNGIDWIRNLVGHHIYNDKGEKIETKPNVRFMNAEIKVEGDDIVVDTRGSRGEAGKGVPAGGQIDQALVKSSVDDYDLKFVDLSDKYLLKTDADEFAPSGYGLGEDSKLITDFDAVIIGGWYHALPSALNPPITNGYFSLTVSVYEEYMEQIAVEVNTQIRYTRNKKEGTWTPWVQAARAIYKSTSADAPSGWIDGDILFVYS